MFETIIQGQGSERAGRKRTVLVSFAIHVLVLGILVVIPLIYYRTIPGGWEDIADVFAAELPDPAPPSPPKPDPPTARPAGIGLTERVVVRVQELVEPPNVPIPDDAQVVDIPIDQILRRPGEGGTAMVPYSEGVGLAIPNVFQPTNIETPPPPPPKPAKPPMLISTLDPSRLIYRVEPIYPPLAIASRVQGSVLLQVTVNEMGVVESVEVKSGHTLLVQAAIDAVKQWRYKPTILNGEPVQVKATVTVNFNFRR